MMAMLCPLCGQYHDTTACPRSLLVADTAPEYATPSWWDGKTLTLNRDGTITVDGVRYRLVEQ